MLVSSEAEDLEAVVETVKLVQVAVSVAASPSLGVRNAIVEASYARVQQRHGAHDASSAQTTRLFVHEEMGVSA